MHTHAPPSFIYRLHVIHPSFVMKRSKEATRPGNKARGSLVSLTINTKTRPPPSQHPNRTTKTGSTRAKEDRSARPSSSSFGRTHSKQKQIQIPAHRRPLQPEEADCAKAIWDAMGKFPHLSRRMPSLRPRSGEDVHQQWELQYPPWRYFNFTGSWDLLKLSKECLRRLCDRLIDDMSQIHDAHVAYVPDVRTLCVVEPRAGADWRPILDGFNFTICPDDELVCWSELKANTIATARAQFAVLEVSKLFLHHLDHVPLTSYCFHSSSHTFHSLKSPALCTSSLTPIFLHGY